MFYQNQSPVKKIFFFQDLSQNCAHLALVDISGIKLSNGVRHGLYSELHNFSQLRQFICLLFFTQ